jgi:glycosyltransferase involved in cell wall biosynthesis
LTAAIIIPALNEEHAIGRVVQSCASFGSVIVVDDGSTDGTGEVARGAGAIVIRHSSNRGYDLAVASGLAEAARSGAGALVTIDADGQLAPALVPQLLAPLQEGTADLVLGIRERPARVAEWLFNLYSRMRFGVPDLLCGLKAVSTGLYLRHQREAARPSVNTALALAGLRSGARVAFVKVPVRPRRGTPRFGSVLSANLKIIRALLIAVLLDISRRPPSNGSARGR